MAADPLTNSAIDDVFNDNFSDLEDDPFADRPGLQTTRDDKAVLSPRSSLKRKSGDDKENDDLGLDEEVKIVKKRKPVAKLDEARLLSEPGIPKLRALSRSGQLMKKLRIKGKGHEFSDAARLLNHLQLWLDNLYPRAKFADALQLVEKAGHSKRMHIMRSEWINEGKPGYRRYEEESTYALDKEPNLFGEEATETTSTGTGTNAVNNRQKSGLDLDEDALFIPDAKRLSRNDHNDEPEDDELDALLAMQDEITTAAPLRKRPQQPEDSEGEDDLDALLAEQGSRQRPPATTPTQSIPHQHNAEEEFNQDEDELDALLSEQMTRSTRPPSNSTNNPQPNQNSDDEDDDHEALLAQHCTKQTTRPPRLPTPQPTSSPSTIPKAAKSAPAPSTAAIFSSSPVPNNPEEVNLDDLDALLASQEERTKARLQDDEEEVMTPRTKKVGIQVENEDVEEEDDFLGSPVPNEESQ